MLASAIVLMSPRALGVIVVQGRGTSMEPNYRDGDVVLIQTTGATNVHIGEIILFRQGGISIFHRIIDKATAPDGHVFLITRGDNNRVADPPVDGSQVQGKLIARLPVAGWLSRNLGASNVLATYRYALLAVSSLGLALTIRRLGRSRTDQTA